ncbi:MAG: hypothetical protein WBL81_00965, partial [Pseudolabrys sp.]
RSYVLTAIRIGLIRPPDSSSMFPWEAREDFNTAWKDYSWLFYEEHLREMIELLKPRRARISLIAAWRSHELQSPGGKPPGICLSGFRATK